MTEFYLYLTINVIFAIGCILPFLSDKILENDYGVVYIMLSFVLIFPSTIVTVVKYQDAYPPKEMVECSNKGGVWLAQKSYNHNHPKYTFNCYQLKEVN